ncbi:hypothetical protein AMATHDRAFT_9542 [Amanita thiersii Skay4041]|uniref:Uncharacterized protein n=1 Tax=Amanita thiersii Skay4041 TaxID=703135 RepID=A0A2A9N7B3_9AGAR|nr:hypothetical protein AMATHDRAFT_9542 [Amanita thiersii Skay4041]
MSPQKSLQFPPSAHRQKLSSSSSDDHEEISSQMDMAGLLTITEEDEEWLDTNCAAGSHLIFDIPSAVKLSDESNTPLTIPSDITFDDLHMAVAEKLQHFPALIQLRYKLASDRQMQPLIVPQKLSSGKISTHALKPILVYFEDATLGNDDLAVKLGPPTKKSRVRNWGLQVETT